MKIFILFFSLFSILHLFDSATCYTIVEETEEKEIVDPDSLYFNRKQKKVIIPQHYGSGDGYSQAIEIRYEKPECHSFCKEERSYEVFSRRLINILLKNSRIKINDDSIATGSINLEASQNELEILRGFGEGIISIRQLDGIIGDVIKEPKIPIYEEFFSYTDMLTFYLFEHRRTFLSILFSIITIPIIIKGTRTKLGIITLLLSVITIISFIMTWQQLLLDAEIKLAAQRNMYRSMPDECSYMDLGFYSSFKLFWGIGKGDCLKYYEAMMKDPMLEVTPSQAFIHMCTKSISYPILLFAKEFSQLIDNITDALPWWIQPIAKPLIFFLTLFLIYALVFIKVGGKIGIRIGPLFHFYIHGRDTVQSQNALNSNERQAVEIIRSEIRDVENTEIQDIRGITNETKPQTASNSSPSKKSPITSKKSTQTEDETKKPDESDSNSDEFLEDNEYEKISKKTIESEIENEVSRSRIEILECDDPEKNKELDKNKRKDKKLLEINDEDS